MGNIVSELYKSMGKFLTPLTIEQTYETIVKEAIRLTGATFASILIWKNRGFERVYSTLPNYQKVTPRKRGFSYQAYKTGKIIVSDRDQITRYHPEFKASDVKHLAFIPLTSGKQSIGVLNLQFNKRNPLSKDQLKVLKLLSSFASLVIRKMQYHEELKSALETRDLFISLASHEFKTPLTSIKIYAQLAQKYTRDGKEMDKRLTDNLLSSVQRLTQLVDAFLQTNQIKKGTLEYYWNEQSLNQILSQAINDFQAMHPDYVISYHNSLNSQIDIIIADQTKFLQAINNLLNNAAKFSPKGSEVTVSLDYKEPNFSITIKDQGVGINQKDLPNIFERFYKGASHREGMGLGLYLTKEIIAKHKGKIFVSSEVNKGTICKIIIPQKNYAW